MGILTKKENKELCNIKLTPTVGKVGVKPLHVAQQERHYKALKNPRLLPENSRGEYK